MGNVGSTSLTKDPSSSLANLTKKLTLTSVTVSTDKAPSKYVFQIRDTHVAAFPAATETLKLKQPVLDTQPLTDGGPNAPLVCIPYSPQEGLRFSFRFVVSHPTPLNALTFICAKDMKDLDEIIGPRFRENLNIHKDNNVHLIGDVNGTKEPLEVEWTWDWGPPTTGTDLDVNNGTKSWNCFCGFVEYSADNNAFHVLSEFAFIVERAVEDQTSTANPPDRSNSFASVEDYVIPQTEYGRTFSEGSIWEPSPTSPSEKLVEKSSSEDLRTEAKKKTPLTVEVPTPLPHKDTGTLPRSPTSENAQSNDLDLSTVEDGPLFRAMIQSHENKTQLFKTGLKRVVKALDAVLDSRRNLAASENVFLDALRSFPSTDPIMAAFLEAAMLKVAVTEENMTRQTEVLLFEPLRRLYENDVKVAEGKKKEFEAESEGFYKFLGKYLSMKNDDGNRPDKLKKKVESDNKFLVKRKSFDLVTGSNHTMLTVRFDYSAYLAELHGGVKDQEIMYHFANFSDKLYTHHQVIAAALNNLRPNLETLRQKMLTKSKEYNFQKKDRNEKRKFLETQSTVALLPALPSSPIVDEGKKDGSETTKAEGGAAEGTTIGVNAPNKFRGMRDLIQNNAVQPVGRRKEGFLFATSRPKTHAGHVGSAEKTSKLSWHKYWCVLSSGMLREYSNWKRQVESHNEPINLRYATCREARASERRFCFEIITPVFTRLYQATSAEEMNAWIGVINNAIEGLLNGTKSMITHAPAGRDNADAMKDGKCSDFAKGEDENASVLDILRADPSNHFCAECNAPSPDWCVINLGAVVCIECSGIHRSLGTHISKVRSLTLDTLSFTSDLILLLRCIGNATSNAIWEARCASMMDAETHGAHSKKPNKLDSRDSKSQFINAKYVERVFVDRTPLDDAPPRNTLSSPFIVNGGGGDDTNPTTTTPMPPPRRPTATELLWAAIGNEDVVEAVRAISLGADVNSKQPPMALASSSRPVLSTCLTPLHLALMLPSLEPFSSSFYENYEEGAGAPSPSPLRGLLRPVSPSTPISTTALSITVPPSPAAATLSSPASSSPNVPDHHLVASTPRTPMSTNYSPLRSSATRSSLGGPTHPHPIPPPLPHHNQNHHPHPKLTTRTLFTMAELLLLNGADPYIVDPTNGYNALHKACDANDPDAVYYLLTKQLDPTVLDAAGKTADAIGCPEAFAEYKEFESERRRKVDEEVAANRKKGDGATTTMTMSLTTGEKSATLPESSEGKTHAAMELLAAMSSPPGKRGARKFFG